LQHYLSTSGLLPTLQSGFRSLHSTETAVLRVLSDILSAVDSEDYAALVLLDLSALFDTVDHDILLQRLQISFGIDATALKWFQSYLTGRTQHVRRGVARSTTVRLICGVPHGSVLGPILFTMYLQLTLSHSSSSTAYRHIYTPTIHRSIARVRHMTSTLYCRTSPSALMLLLTGCQPLSLSASTQLQ